MVPPMSTVTSHDDLVYNPYAFATHDDPYVLYKRLRDEAPVWWNDDLKFWVISRFTDVTEAFRDHETFCSRGGIALENRRPLGKVNPKFQQMIELDPPEHTSFRRLVSRVFTQPKVIAMEAEIRGIIDGYIDRIIESGSGDLVADITGPFPMDVISAILGLPEHDRLMLRHHADSLLIREDGSMMMTKEGLDGMFALLEYFAADLARRRGEGGAGLITDLLDLEVEGRSLTEQELLGFCILFVVAGHETTTKMVANAVEVLSRHPDQMAELIADPSLIPGAIEEVLRYHPSTQYMVRTLTRDHELRGVKMREGDSVLLLIGAANHDEREFGPTSEEFDIHRTPRHLAFGYGVHFCMGAALARMEGKVALQQILSRLVDLRVDRARTERFHSGNVTGWVSLPISFTPGAPL